jgi:nitrite reductase/ring-hydroxylating ferredoxin subunit
VLDPVTSILTSGLPMARWTEVPFQPLGLAALAILFAMAATSHDFWLRNLSARAWKALHQCVYLAFALLVAHVAFGVLQDRVPVAFGVLAALVVVWLSALHIAAGLRERRIDRRARELASDGWVKVGGVDEIPMGRAKTVLVGEARRVAVFRHERGFSAISGVCAHQGGPLAEGRIVDGCVTCPWHGYQYLVESGQSPPPFFEKVPTYELRIEGRTIFVQPQAKAPGTPVPPCAVREAGEASP